MNCPHNKLCEYVFLLNTMVPPSFYSNYNPAIMSNGISLVMNIALKRRFFINEEILEEAYAK